MHFIMKGTDKLYIKKYEAVDFGVGTYNSRTLKKRERYHQRDFLAYLSLLEYPADSELAGLIHDADSDF
jgi:hypothetical protein